ncbi:MAG: hypothetical protein JO256_14175 [Alphaproteobacteria bacterium]|nr:hypothetical protein [Alphaproteobacteria bacterium]
MGIARLLAKGWLLFCLVAGGHALHLALEAGTPAVEAWLAIPVCVLLFAAMGLLFIGGFGVSGGLPGTPLRLWTKPHHFFPGFNEIVFLIFVAMSFVVQVVLAPLTLAIPAAQALERAVAFAIPGQLALVRALDACNMDGGRVFAAAFSWLLAAIYFASACSRLKLQAGLIRLEQGQKPEIIGPALRAFIFGAVAVAAIQFLVMGSVFPLLECRAYFDITGALLTGLAPLMTAYLVVAAMASLLASAPEA